LLDILSRIRGISNQYRQGRHKVQGGNVWLVAGTWHRDFIEELESFPNGRYVDQVDACSGAFNRLTNTPGSTIDWGWMD
jgi:phage terminase large subunit-like protein